MTDQKPMPKSLHTITAIVRVARYVLVIDEMSAEDAIKTALDVLGYVHADDPHGLAAKALAQLSA